jgi:hypothetical protein
MTKDEVEFWREIECMCGEPRCVLEVFLEKNPYPKPAGSDEDFKRYAVLHLIRTLIAPPAEGDVLTLYLPF